MNQALPQEDFAGSNQGVLVTKQLLGIDFLQTLFSFTRAAEIHDPSNKVFENPLHLLHRTASDWTQIFGFESLDLLLKGEQFFINERRIRPKPKVLRKLKALVKFFRTRNIIGFHLPQAHRKEDLNIFIWTLIQIKKGESAARINEELRSKGLEGFEITTLSWTNSKEWVESASAAEAIYQQLYSFAKDCFSNPKVGTLIEKPPPLDHILYDLNSVSEEDLVQIICKKTVETADHSLAHISVMTALLLYGWGRVLGLPPFAIVELAGSGLAHPFTVIHASESLETSDALQINRSAILLRNISSFERIWHITDLQMLALFEFPIPFGEQGVYEVSGRRCYLHIFSRMLRIGILFQRMICPDRRRQTNLSPSEAVGRLLTKDLGCDPSLVRLFANWLGVYPVGTFVRMATGEIGQVCSTNSDLSQAFRPCVKILRERDGGICENPKTVDLSDLNEKLGIYQQAIQSEVSFVDTGLSADQYASLMKAISLATS